MGGNAWERRSPKAFSVPSKKISVPAKAISVPAKKTIAFPPKDFAFPPRKCAELHRTSSTTPPPSTSGRKTPSTTPPIEFTRNFIDYLFRLRSWWNALERCLESVPTVKNPHFNHWLYASKRLSCDIQHYKKLNIDHTKIFSLLFEQFYT